MKRKRELNYGGEEANSATIVYRRSDRRAGGRSVTDLGEEEETRGNNFL